MLTEREKKRYSRHLVLDGVGEPGQEKLKSAAVLVVGAGGLGCPALQYLTAAGVGTIGIVDDDYIDESNLQRQVLYSTEEIGLQKALVAKKKLQQLNLHVAVEAYAERLTFDRALQLFPNYDIILDCTDNFEARYNINDAAVLTGRPFVSGSVFKYEGQLSVFNYQNGPTYRCLYPDENRLGFGCTETGVLGVLPGIIGSYLAMEVIKILVGTGEVLSGKLRIINTLTNDDRIIEFDRDKDQVQWVKSKEIQSEMVKL